MGDIHRMGVSEKVVDKVEGGVGAVVRNTLAPRWAKMNLAKQVAVASRMLRLSGVVAFRSRFMPGFVEDLKDKRIAGATDEEIISYYFGCPEFVAFWNKLGNTEDTLKELLEGYK